MIGVSPRILLPAERATAPEQAASVGMFAGHGDVGNVLHPGSAVFDTEARSYTVMGSGDNMWAARDAFHFVWKTASGDLALTADVSFPGTGKEAHRKACLLFRQSLDASSPSKVQRVESG